MRAVCNPKPTQPVERTTWYYLSNKSEELLFNLSYPHFVARAGRMKTGIVSDGSYQDMARITEQMIPTAGTVLEMIELFTEGASVGFSDPKVAHVAYKRILDHLSLHARLMRTDKMYEAPDPQFFKDAAEFAMKIRSIVKIYDTDVDNPGAKKTIKRGMRMFPRFSDSLRMAEEEKLRQEGFQAPEVEMEEVTAAPLRKLDAIERYLEQYGNG
jgi:hypothetical protein